ncbi:tRNA1(Val) (adenine(37)-N6)-methyltransferase [Mangrovibacterium sp.]|uniref:tRNA1(Val) (adenine(37)-N6)-methyltransferase n=1 Tax=Mangrovibacterium sp. TaxID=1961364 RepID=UPI0035670758
MGRNNFFQFKQFRIVQQKAAMKVGIDGVLLGAWADVGSESRILDVGAGTGLLALMMAQRTKAQVDAVEIDADAATEAQSNFDESPWANRLRVYRQSFQEYESECRYDHLISNPPFFDEAPQSPDQKRARARHADSLSLEELLEKSVGLLADCGKLSLVLPADKEERLRSIARSLDFYVTRFARVFPDETKKSHRILVELSRKNTVGWIESIYIRERATGVYTDQYRTLTKGFYLAF